jgi:hypothetical protein
MNQGKTIRNTFWFRLNNQLIDLKEWSKPIWNVNRAEREPWINLKTKNLVLRTRSNILARPYLVIPERPYRESRIKTSPRAQLTKLH